jgi:hypothetical protein
LAGNRTVDDIVTYDVVRLDITDPADIAHLRDALRIAEADTYGHCLTIGEHRLELWAGDEVITYLELIGWDSLRWTGKWKGDAELADPMVLESWLLRHGLSDAQQAREEMETSTAAGLQNQESWGHAMPPCLLPLWSWSTPSGVALDVAHTALEQSELWFGSGAGPWNWYPSYEGTAEQLLLKYPIATLLAALTEQSEPGLLGAARLLCGWDFDQTRKGERAQCPEPLRQRMLQAVERQGIADNIGSFRHAFDMPDS